MGEDREIQRFLDNQRVYGFHDHLHEVQLGREIDNSHTWHRKYPL